MKFPARTLAVVIAFLPVATLMIGETQAADKKSPQTGASLPREPLVEITAKVLSLPEEIYQKNKPLFTALTEASSENEMLGALAAASKLKGADLMGMPSITITSGQTGRIEMVHEFRHPTAYDQSRTPKTFETHNLGSTYNFSPTVKDGAILLNSKFSYCEFLGFVAEPEGKLKLPSFQTRETYLWRKCASGVPSVFIIPWAVAQTRSFTADDLDKPASPSQRLIFCFTATIVKNPYVAARQTEQLLRATTLNEISYDKAPLDKVLADIITALNKQSPETPYSFYDSLKRPNPKVTFSAASASAHDLLATVEKQTGYSYAFFDSRLIVEGRGDSENDAHRIDYSAPIPSR